MSADGPWEKLRKELNGQRIVIAALEDRHVQLQRENAGLLEQLHEMRGRLDSRQAFIDALMMEFCPEDMTPDQRARWAAHQVPAKGSEGPK